MFDPPPTSPALFAGLVASSASQPRGVGASSDKIGKMARQQVDAVASTYDSGQRVSFHCFAVG